MYSRIQTTMLACKIARANLAASEYSLKPSFSIMNILNVCYILNVCFENQAHAEHGSHS